MKKAGAPIGNKNALKPDSRRVALCIRLSDAEYAGLCRLAETLLVKPSVLARNIINERIDK